MDVAVAAYDSHRGPKALVRYEDLRADALATMRRMYSALGATVDAAALRASVEKHDWENVPEDQRGAGKFRRKGRPGAWREDLAPGQARAVEEECKDLMQRLGYAAP